jgi:hypothetical protein
MTTIFDASENREGPRLASAARPPAGSALFPAGGRYGATPEEWEWAVDTFGGSNLLPVVSNPHAKISSSSNLKSIGKTPSRYSSAGGVVGFPKWTSHRTSERELAEWTAQEDYGIFVVTREGHAAIDVDVDEPAKALRYARAILEGVGLDPDAHACRWRESSGRVLVPVRLDAERRKSVIPVEGGNVEILGLGNGYVACGLHVGSGVRYRWSPLSALAGDLA